MAISPIITADDVRTRMTLPDLDEINETIDSAMTAAQVYIQSILETQFDPSDRVEVFRLDSANIAPQNSFFRLRLSQAFVDVDSVSVLYGDSVSTMLDVLDLSADSKLDAEKGVLHIADIYDGRYLQVTYSAGFGSAYKAPDYLKEAMLTYVSEVLGGAHGASPETNTSSKADAVKAGKSEGFGVPRMLEPYMRGRAFQIRPIW